MGGTYLESSRTLLQVSGPHPRGQAVCPSLSFSPLCGRALRTWPPGWPRSGWAASHPCGKGRQSQLRTQAEGTAWSDRGWACLPGSWAFLWARTGWRWGRPGHLDIRGRELPGCQEDVLLLLHARSEPSMPEAKVGGVSKEDVPRGSPRVPTLVPHTRPRDQLTS